ncbi:sulfite exporter TauE/SafE family protein [Pseudomonas sp. R2.Fl]|nr:sulfite exporter TauE/SafE family protein [Pseudomonas sp. R2.Fl]
MEALVIGAVTLISGAFRGVTGFGYALMAASGLVGSFSPIMIVPFILINDLILTAFTIVDRGRSPVDWPVTRLLLVSGLAGAACGSLSLGLIDDQVARILVSIVIVVAAGVALIHHPPVWLAHRAFGLLLGFVVGYLLSLFGVGGPLVAAWLLAGGSRSEAVRGTLAVYFGVIDVFTLASRFYLGAVPDELFRMLLIYCPLTFLGFIGGYIVANRLPASAWRRTASGGLVLIALIGLAQAIYSMSAI